MHPRLLIADRDSRYAEWLRRHLGVLCPDATINVLDPEKLRDADESITRETCDLLLFTAAFGSSPEDPASGGLELLRQFRARADFPPAIAIAEEGNELTAVRAVQLGALDYLPKRFLTPERLKTSVHLALRRVERRIARRVAKLAQTSNTSETCAEALGASALASPPVVEPGLIPGYTICEALGESEKAVVYRAASSSLGRDVALKISKSDRAEGQLLAREYAAASSLRHPAIVEIHDYGTHAGREFLAMELFPRGDLKARLQQPLTEGDALRYLEQIAAALRVVHQAGLLHRDLKPPNVMLREDDTVALIDFGLARNLEGGLQSTRTGVLRGSPYYMSPEQALGEELDARTDLYSLGVMLYEMLTGRKPFTGTSAIEVLQEHVSAPVPQLPLPLAHHQALLERLLAKSRDERFASADEVLAECASARALQDPCSSAA
jgi:eukaryotic-like serine/threonine-protein kinase